MRIAAICALLAMSLPAPAAGQSLAERAAALPAPEPRFIENIKVGIRSVTFAHMAISVSNPKTMYIGSYDGYVFATHDGGLSWSEGRLIVQRQGFYGAIRPSPPPTGAPFSMDGALGGVGAPGHGSSHGLLGHDVGDLLSFPYGTTGQSYLDFAPDGPAFWGHVAASGLPKIGRTRVRDQAGGGGGGGDIARLGVGNTSGAPHLQRMLRQRRYKVVGMNMKLLLALRGVEPTWASHVAAHPTNPKVAWVATALGAFRTEDGGLGWDHIFPGSNARERWINWIDYDPADARRVFMGTDQGLLISDDNGETWIRPTGTQLSTALTLWLTFHRADPKIIYAGTNIGVFRSDDGGRIWRWVFFETLDAANNVRGVAIDPTNADRVTIATKDGLFRTANGGKSWERSGGFLFTSQAVWRIVADPQDPDHVICSTSRNIWETHDWGETWSALYINDSDWSARALLADPTDPGVMWVLTSDEILRVSSRPPPAPAPRDLAALRRQLAAEPTLGEVHEATLRAYLVHRGELAAMRGRSFWRTFMPRLHAYAGYIDVDADASIDAVYLQDIIGEQREGAIPGRITTNAIDQLGKMSGERDDVFLLRDQRGGFPYAGVRLSWDLRNIFYDQDEVPFGRMFTDNNRVYLHLKYEAQRLYEERRRLLIRLFTAAPDDLTSVISLRLRLLEITSLLEFHTDGLYTDELDSLVRAGMLGHTGRSP